MYEIRDDSRCGCPCSAFRMCRISETPSRQSAAQSPAGQGTALRLAMGSPMFLEQVHQRGHVQHLVRMRHCHSDQWRSNVSFRLSLAFSIPRPRSRLTSDASTPPYFFRRVWTVAGLIPCRGQMSSACAPAWLSFRTAMIFFPGACAAAPGPRSHANPVKRRRVMGLPPSVVRRRRIPVRNNQAIGEEVTTNLACPKRFECCSGMTKTRG